MNRPPEVDSAAAVACPASVVAENRPAAEAFMQRPFGHHFPLGVMSLFVEMVLGAAVSLRGAAAVIELVSRWLPGPDATPTAAGGQNWLLRLGLYALDRDKQKADDWAWIVDHTIQLGSLKVFLVVGVRLSAWNGNRGPLTHHDLEVVLMEPVPRSTGEVVQEQLERAAEKTGPPRMILSDHGTDLKRGIGFFCQKHPQTAAVDDIKHYAARMVKRELEGNPRWSEFIRNTNQTKTKIRQTGLAHLMPPAPRTKARFMNVDVFVHWGQTTLACLESSATATLDDAQRKELQTKLGWLRGFGEELSQWGAMVERIDEALDEIRNEGYHAQSAARLGAVWKEISPATPGGRMASELLKFVGSQSCKAEQREHLLGSSEVLESLIGKGKRLHGQHSKGGFTKMLLAMAAAVTPSTGAVLRAALDRIKTRDVTNWTRQHLGVSLTSQRRLAYANAEQNQHKQPNSRNHRF